MTISLVRFKNLSRVFNIEHYGDVAEGSNITLPLRSALAAAANYGPKAIVYIPQGGGTPAAYTINPWVVGDVLTLIVPPNVTLIGDGIGNTIIRVNTAQYAQSMAKVINAYTTRGDIRVIGMQSGSRVEHMTINGNRGAVPAGLTNLTTALVATMKGAHNCTISNVRVYAASNKVTTGAISGAIELLDSQGSVVEDCISETNDGHGIAIRSILLEQSLRSRDCTIIRSTATSNTHNGIHISGAGLGNLVDDCSVITNTKHGLFLDTSEYVHIDDLIASNNVISDVHVQGHGSYKIETPTLTTAATAQAVLTTSGGIFEGYMTGVSPLPRIISDPAKIEIINPVLSNNGIVPIINQVQSSNVDNDLNTMNLGNYSVPEFIWDAPITPLLQLRMQYNLLTTRLPVRMTFPQQGGLTTNLNTVGAASMALTNSTNSSKTAYTGTGSTSGTAATVTVTTGINGLLHSITQGLGTYFCEVRYKVDAPQTMLIRYQAGVTVKRDIQVIHRKKTKELGQWQSYYCYVTFDGTDTSLSLRVMSSTLNQPFHVDYVRLWKVA